MVGQSGMCGRDAMGANARTLPVPHSPMNMRPPATVRAEMLAEDVFIVAGEYE